ncbi:PLP-dependent aminotransferase family protein [Nocardiopsis sp. NPDC058631]|uniref:aminotransferase-like domain-containing protein n=1 Tax=Nocardiopsis sp. NPDC058631 TaxID=3346566 RepID=UPI003649A630
MNLLNEIGEHFPEAISFAAGKPFEGFLSLDSVHEYLDAFRTRLTDRLGMSEEQVARRVLQYGSARGIINDLVARHLEVDERIRVSPEQIVVTSGCQEALYLVLRALRGKSEDAVLTVRPTYSGLDAAAQLVDMPVLSIDEPADGIDGAHLTRAVNEARGRGYRPRALYVTPDFANPTGRSLTLEARESLLDAAAECEVLLLEDNPYGNFGPEGEHPPTLKSLDPSRCVVYLGSFAKSGLPGARVGYVVADQNVTEGDCGDSLLADQIARLKGMLSINTSPIAQAVIGGKILLNDFSLRRANERERTVYQENLECLLASFEENFPEVHGERLHGVSFNTPRGGFFMTVTLPFASTDEILRLCGEKYGVLWTPMHHFHGDGTPRNEVRFAFSHLSRKQIRLGVQQFASFVADHADR